ncbi:hypothetical protein A2U01_0053501, partial [Trifolium medium]|nr:hypothetical protein [Trifolium medium]
FGSNSIVSKSIAVEESGTNFLSCDIWKTSCIPDIEGGNANL